MTFSPHRPHLWVPTFVLVATLASGAQGGQTPEMTAANPSQTAPAPAPPNTLKQAENPPPLTTPERPSSPGWFDWLFKGDPQWIRPVAEGGGAALLATLAGGLAWMTRTLKKRISGPFERFVTRHDAFYHKVMVLGIGGTGKTTLINRITGDPSANPRAATLDYDRHSVKQALVDENTSREWHFSFDDYRGQNPGILVQAIATEAATNGQTPSYSAIVLVVDLFPAPGETDPTPAPSSQWDRKRVQKHLDGWTDAMIDTFRGFAPKASYICLFINKYDLIEPRSEMVERQIRSAFRPLAQRLEARSRGAVFEVLVGSLSNHMGVTKVFSELVTTAKRVN